MMEERRGGSREEKDGERKKRTEREKEGTGERQKVKGKEGWRRESETKKRKKTSAWNWGLCTTVFFCLILIKVSSLRDLLKRTLVFLI